MSNDREPEQFPRFEQVNLVVADMDASIAFYRLLGLDIPDGSIWRDGAGAHCRARLSNNFDLEFDSPALARAYNKGWDEANAGSGRVALMFRMPSLASVDEMFATLTEAGIGPPSRLTTHFGGRGTPS